VAPLTEAVSGMSVNTLLHELARNARFWDFYPRICQKLERDRKKIGTYQLIIHFEKQCLMQVGYCGQQFILQSTDYLKISKAE